MPLTRTAGGLPTEATSFVGRRAELAYLAQAVRANRLVTITGPGGVGKTRLAMQAASRAAESFADGVCLVRLSSLQAPGLLPNTVAAAIGLIVADREAMDAVLDYLRDREMLLILDTCEHLIEAAAAFARAVADKTERVTVLATSRQPLGVPGERRFPLEPLPVPDEETGQSEGDAVDLFVQRATTVVPGFTLDEQNRADVIMICHRLAGIPLALELAAVRLRALSVRELVEGFSLEISTGSRRTGVPRHRDLRSALGWSYDLCTQEERTVWRRLSVFAGSFAFSAISAVCKGGNLDRDDVAEAVDGLVLKSVLIQLGDEDDDRYRMLDPIREFGADELNASGAGIAVRGKYIAYYLGLARGFNENSVSGSQLRRYAELRREHSNIRAAMEYAFAMEGNERAGVDISTFLFVYWNMAGLAWEGEYWVNRGLDRCSATSPLSPRILAVRAFLRCMLGEFDSAQQDAVDAIRGAERIGDDLTVARAHCALHRTLTWTGDLARAGDVAARASRLLEEEGDGQGKAQLAAQLTLANLQAKDIPAAVRVAERGLAELSAGEFWARSYLLGLTGICLFLTGDQEPAIAVARQALRLKHELGDVAGIAYITGVLGLMEADAERHERAVWLLGAAEAGWGLVGRRYTGNVFLEAWHERATAAARSSLGRERYSQLWDQGMRASSSATALVAARDSEVPEQDSDRPAQDFSSSP